MGQTAFAASLAGVGVDFFNRFGIYATDFDGQLVEIAREGDLFDANGDPLIKDLRTISHLSVVTGSGNEDGRSSTFNDLGQFAFAATFTDDTSGVFVADIISLPDDLGVVNIDFEAGVPSDTAHAAADGILSTTGTVWNSVAVGVNASGLTDEFGNTTALGVTFSLPGSTEGDVDSASTNNLQDSGVKATELQITGLLPGETYEIAGYVMDFAGFRVEDATGDLGFKGSGGPTYNLPGIEAFPFSGTQRGDYIRFTDLIPADLGNGVFGITISTDGALTGLQIRGVIPERIVLPGDLDGDGFVGITDLNIVLGNWNQNVPPGNTLADPSGDGFVGIEDLNAVLGNWNAGVPPGAPSAENTHIPEPASLGMLLVGSWALPRRRRRVA